MSETFKATLRLKPGRGWGTAFVMEDVDTGKEHRIFPTELGKLIEGYELTGEWAKTSRGSVPSVRLVSDNGPGFLRRIIRMTEKG